MKRLLQASSLTMAMLALLLAPTTTAQAQSEGLQRSGFTLLLDLGVGIQNTDLFDGTAVGLGGLNLGIGGFITEEMALWFRAAGTLAKQDGGVLGDIDATSGTGALAVQYWTNDNFNLEGGLGFGFAELSLGDASESGLGLLLGAGYSFWNNGKHSLQVGGQYAPVFLDGSTFHNISITFGWQLL